MAINSKKNNKRGISASNGKKPLDSSAAKSLKHSKSKKVANGSITIRWDNKYAISSVASDATAKANRISKRVTGNIVELKGSTLIKRDASTGKFVEVKKINPVVVKRGKITLNTKRSKDGV